MISCGASQQKILLSDVIAVINETIIQHVLALEVLTGIIHVDLLWGQPCKLCVAIIVSTPVVVHTASNYVAQVANSYYIAVFCRFLNCKRSMSRSVANGKLVKGKGHDNQAKKLHLRNACIDI